MRGAGVAWDRLRAHWPFKVVAGALISLAFFAAYFAIQRFSIASARTMRPTAIDRWVGFHPATTPLYWSLWLYMSLIPWLTVDLDELRRYARTVAVMCAIGLACFALWPTKVGRPTLHGDEGSLYTSMVSVDGSRNACPSLHAAFTIFSALCIADAVRGRRLVLLANFFWCVGILYATLATKQHVLIDLVAGAPLGIGGWWYFRATGERR